jgi:hypothetical protein
MADKKISQLTAGTAISIDDLLVMVDDPAGAPETKKITPDLLGIIGGWVRAAYTWTYVSATTFTIPADVTAYFTVGKKIRYKQGAGYKYGYVLSASYSAPDTTVTIAGDALANAAITDNDFSDQASPAGFPGWFNATCAMSGSGGTVGTYAETNAYSRFAMHGKTVIWQLRKQLTNLGSWSGDVKIDYPVRRSAATSPVFGGGYVYANSAAAASPKAILGKAAGAAANFYKTVLGNLQWSDLAINDWVLIDTVYEAE